MTETRALASPAFARFWVTNWVTEFGDRVTELALPLVAVTLLAATPGEVGLLTAAVWLPALVSILIGSWVDQRLSKRMIMVMADLGSAVVLLAVPLAYVVGVLSLPLLVGVGLVAGTLAVFYRTAYPAYFVALVPRAAYLDANAKLSVSRSASFIAGPAVGGVLVQVLTAPFAIFLDAISFVFSAVVVARLDVPDPPVDETSDTWWRRCRAGLQILFADARLRAKLACVTTVNLFTFMVFALLVLFANRDLGLSPGVIGISFGIGSVGGLVGAWATPWLSQRYGVGPVATVGAALFCAPLGLVALAGGPVWSAAAVIAVSEMLSGIGVMLMDINLNSLNSVIIPDHLRSRVSGAFATINYGSRPVGAALGGLLGGVLGVRETILAAALCGSAGALFLLWSPIRGIRSLDDVRPLGEVAPPITQARG